MEIHFPQSKLFVCSFGKDDIEWNQYDTKKSGPMLVSVSNLPPFFLILT